MSLTASVFSAAERSHVVWASPTEGLHRGTPCVTEDRVVLNLTPQGSVTHCRMAAVDHEGALLWESNGRTAMSAEPLVADGRVYAPSPSGLVCVSLEDGSPVWKTDPVEMMGWLPEGQDPWEADGGVGRAALSPDGSTVYFGLVEGTLVALDADSGEEIWHRAGTHFMNDPAPVVTTSGSVVCNADQGFLSAVSPEGELEWERRLGRDITAPVLEADGRACLASRDGQVMTVDLATGEPVRTFSVEGREIRVTPVLDQGRVLVASETSGAPREGRLHCLQPDGDGFREVWSVDLPAAPRSVAVDAQGLVAVSCGDRGVKFFEPDGAFHGMVADQAAAELATLADGTFLANGGHRVEALRPTLQTLDAPVVVEDAFSGSIETEGAWVTIGGISLQVRE